jgi:hypothetical protein
MKLHIIKHLVNFAEQKDVDYLQETTDTLESLTELDRISDEELDVIGELLSNLSGAIEVSKMIKNGTPKTEAINTFMKRVVGSIDK